MFLSSNARNMILHRVIHALYTPKVEIVQRRKSHLELSSNKNELLTALLESSVMSTLILEMTWKVIGDIVERIHWTRLWTYNCHKQTYIRRYTSCVIIVVPVQSTYSIQLLNTQDLQKSDMIILVRGWEGRNQVKKNVGVFSWHIITVKKKEQSPEWYLLSEYLCVSYIWERERLTGHKSLVISS